MPSSPELTPTDRTRVRRKTDRGTFEWDTIASILDEALVAHVGFAVDGRTWVMPMAFCRIDDQLYLHGASGNAALRALAAGADVCVTATLLDGLVLARSAFHHSMNYRSVMVFGRATAVTDEDEKRRALVATVDHMQAGRSDGTRGPTASEMRATSVVRLPIVEASAKVRTGGPIDDEEDYALPHWAGVVPITLVRGEPVADEPSS